MNRVKSGKLQDDYQKGEGLPDCLDKQTQRLTPICWDRFYDDEFLGYEAFIIRFEESVTLMPFANI